MITNIHCIWPCTFSTITYCNKTSPFGMMPTSTPVDCNSTMTFQEALRSPKWCTASQTSIGENMTIYWAVIGLNTQRKPRKINKRSDCYFSSIYSLFAECARKTIFKIHTTSKILGVSSVYMYIKRKNIYIF